MKKTALILSLIVPAIALAGCGKTPIAETADRSPHRPNTRSQTNETVVEPPQQYNICFGFPGVRRHFCGSLAGVYTVEYIHYATKDGALDCKLTINEDNSYTMSFTKNGTTVDHNGKCYGCHDSVTFFFDEEKPTYVPEVYYPDSIGASIIDGGKLMMYEGGNVIVLSRAENSETIS